MTLYRYLSAEPARRLWRRTAKVAIDSAGQPTANANGCGLVATKVRTGTYKLAPAENFDVLQSVTSWVSDGTDPFIAELAAATDPTAGSIILRTKKKLPATESQTTRSTTTDRTHWQKDSADALASTTTAEFPFFQAPIDCIVTEIRFTPNVASAASASHYATITVSKRNGKGGGATTVGSWSTLTTAQGTLAANTASSFSLGLDAAKTLQGGEILTVEITKTGNGVIVGAGHLDVFYTRKNVFENSKQMEVRWTKELADAAANTATAETVIARQNAPGVVSAVYWSGGAIANDATDTVLFTVSKRDGAGGNAVSLATYDTTTGQNGAVTAFVPASFTLTATTANLLVLPGDILTLTIAKANAGKTVTAGTLVIVIDQFDLGKTIVLVQKDAADGAAGTATTEYDVVTIPEARTVQSVYYLGGAVAADNTDYLTMTVSTRDGLGGAATTTASYATPAGNQGAITANVPARFSNGAGVSLTAGSILTFKVVKSGAGKVLPPGVILVNFATPTIKTCRWVKSAADGAASTATSEVAFFRASKQCTISSLKFVSATAIAAHATDIVTFIVRRRDAFGASSETLGTWATTTGSEGAITADIPAALTLTSTTDALVLAVGDQLTVEITKGGSGKTVGPGSITAAFTESSADNIYADPVSRDLYCAFDLGATTVSIGDVV